MRASGFGGEDWWGWAAPASPWASDFVYIIDIYSNMDRTVHSQTFTDYNASESLFDSRYTRITQPQENEDNWFTEQRAYSRSVLAGWGMPLGELPYSADN